MNGKLTRDQKCQLLDIAVEITKEWCRGDKGESGGINGKTTAEVLQATYDKLLEIHEGFSEE